MLILQEVSVKVGSRTDSNKGTKHGNSFRYWVVLTNLWLLLVALGVILMAQGHIFIISWHLTSVTNVSLPNYPSIHSSTNMFQIMQCWSFLGTLGFLYTFPDSQPLCQNNMEGWIPKAFLGHGCWGDFVSYQASTLKKPWKLFTLEQSHPLWESLRSDMDTPFLLIFCVLFFLTPQ